MPIITFRGYFTAMGGGLWAIKFYCDNNQTFGRCRVRLVNGSFFASSVGTYQGMYRLDSLDGQMSVTRAPSNYSGLLLNPFDAGQFFNRDMLQYDNSFEFETTLTSSNITLQMTPANLPPFTSHYFNVSNFDTGFMVFEVEKL